MVFSSELLLKIIFLRKVMRKRRRKPRSQYIRDIFRNRMLRGESFLVSELNHDAYYHHRYFRMSRESFEYIYNRIKDQVEQGRCHQFLIPLEMKLSIAMRYLATGNSQISLALNYRVSPASVSNFIREILQAICDTLTEEYLKVPSKEEWEAKAQDFFEMWNFPFCCGSIDGKHVRVKCPGQSASLNYNYKNFFSVVLFAVADANYCFSLVDIGRKGSLSDGGVLIRSPINGFIEKGDIILPEDGKLPNGNNIPYCFLGDDGFPLKRHLLRPYSGKWLSKEDRIFNYRLSRARLVVENAFGILAARWRIFHTCIDAKPDLVNLIIKSSIILHNYLIRNKDTYNLTADRETENGVIPGNWREQVSGHSGFQELTQQGSNNYTQDAALIRNALRDYFNSPSGSVKWQDDKVMEGYE